MRFISILPVVSLANDYFGDKVYRVKVETEYHLFWGFKNFQIDQFVEIIISFYESFFKNLSQATISEAAEVSDIWKEARHLGDFTDVHVPAEKIGDIEQMLASVGLSYEEIISDVGVAAEQSVSSMSPRSVAKYDHIIGTISLQNDLQNFYKAHLRYTNLDNFNYEKYHWWEDYQKWQTDFVNRHSDIAEKLVYGDSFEGRELNLMKIGKGSKV